MARVRVLPADARSPGRGETDASLSLANRMPRLVLESRRVAATLAHGLHGRRRAGPGESFWQFRPFVAGEGGPRIDWRGPGPAAPLFFPRGGGGGGPPPRLWVDPPAPLG